MAEAPGEDQGAEEGLMENTIVRVDQDEPSEDPAAVQWEPMWRFTVGQSEVGASIDDNCVVFLAQIAPGHWVPMTHVPGEAVRFVSNLLSKPE